MSKKVICLLSDGLDSPVATFLLEQKGLEVIGLNFDNQPYVSLKTGNSNTDPLSKTSLPNNKFAAPIFHIAQILVNSFKTQTHFELYQMPHGNDLKKIIDYSNDPKLTCVLCKRLMLMKAQELAEKLDADYIATGEILGEQASQTIDNLHVIESTLSNKKLLRPNIGLNKEEVITIARKIGTIKYSEEAAKFTCTAVPDKPSTQATLDRALLAESNLNTYNLISTSLDSREVFIFQKKS